MQMLKQKSSVKELLVEWFILLLKNNLSTELLVSSELDTIVYSDRTSSEYIPMLSKYMRNQTPLSFWDVEL